MLKEKASSQGLRAPSSLLHEIFNTQLHELSLPVDKKCLCLSAPWSEESSDAKDEIRVDESCIF